MKEQLKTYQDEKTSTFYYLNQKNIALDRKYSLDKGNNFYLSQPNFHHFSNFAQGKFISQDQCIHATNSFNLNQSFNNYDFYYHPQTSDILLDEVGDNINSPSTPNSFGFKQCPFRRANASIQQDGSEKKFPNVMVCLVGDTFDQSKAGLLFKYQNTEIDLKISKKEGVQLQNQGQLKNIFCELWFDDLAEWIQVQATITLHPNELLPPIPIMS